MRLRRILFLFAILISMSAKVLGSNDSVVLCYRFDSLAVNKHGNAVISELANDNGLSLRKCSIQYNYTVQFNAFIHESEQEIVVKLIPKEVSGITRYRKYDLGQVLWPGIIQAKLEWFNNDGTQKQSKVIVIHNYTVKTELPINATNIKINLLKPIIDASFEKNFNKLSSLVKDYQALRVALQRGNELIELADFDKGDAVLSLLYYAEASRIIQKVDSMNLQDSLPLQTNDPLDLLVNQKSLTVECYRRSLALERLLSKERDDKPLDSKKATQLFVELVAFWVKQPDFLNPAHNKVFTGFATYNWSGAWCVSLSKQFNTLFGFKDDYELQVFLRIQGTEILHGLQNISNLLIENQSYNQSAMVMANAIRLARSLRMHNEADALARLIAKSTAGIYTSYLQVAESAIANGQMPMAEKYLRKALDYKAKNGGEILDQISQENAFELFANACLAKGESLNTMGYYVDALQYLNKAKEYALMIGFYVNAEQLRNLLCDVHQHLYDETLMLAITEFKNGNLLMGAGYYKNARDMRLLNQQFIRKRNEEDSLYLSERKGFVVDSFNRAMDLINSKMFEEASKLANRALFIADSLEFVSDSTVCTHVLAVGASLFQYKITCTGSALWDYEPKTAWQYWLQADRIAVNFYLTDCEQVNEEIDGYKTKIENLECLLHTKQFETYAARAEANYNRQNFITGQAFADSALNLKQPNIRCVSDILPLQKLRGQYVNAAVYQSMLNRLEVAYSLQKPDSIDALRVKLHKFYQLHQIELKAFVQPTVEWFLYNHQRNDLVNYYLQQLFKEGNYVQCIKLLDVLRTNGYKAENTVEFQRNLGTIMAETTNLEADLIKVEIYLNELVPDKIWFASYRKAFVDKKIPVIQHIKNKLNEINTKGG